MSKTKIKFEYSRPNWKIRLALFFVGKRVKIVKDFPLDWRMEYKIFRGVWYVTSFNELPPTHFNCKSDIEFIGGDHYAN